MLNVVVIMGRLTAQPELRTTGNGISVSSFSVAVDRSYQSGGERQTDFINCVAWRANADFITKYFTKGQMIAIRGTLQQRSYTDKDGNKRTTYDVVVDQAQFCGSKQESGGAAPAVKEVSPASFSNVDTGDFEEISMGDDDLPF